jgi:hypothetical protein
LTSWSYQGVEEPQLVKVAVALGVPGVEKI